MSQDDKFAHFSGLNEEEQYRRLDEQQKKMKSDAYRNASAYRDLLDEILSKVDNLRHIVEMSKASVACCDTINTGLKLDDANKCVVWIINAIREMQCLFPSEIGEIYPPSATEKMAENISVGYTDEGWLHIVMQALLPHKRKSVNKSIIHYSLAYAIDKFLKVHERQIFGEATMIIRQVYADDVPLARRKDCDNVETSVVVNTVSAYFLRDDSPDVLSIFLTAKAGEKNATEVFLVPDKSFIPWKVRYK